MAPVQEVSLVGFGFCTVGSGCAVLTIQSALPAVSALLLSKRTRWRVAACAGWDTPATAAEMVSADKARRVRARAIPDSNRYLFTYLETLGEPGVACPAAGARRRL